MAATKHMRQERRTSSFYLMVTALIFIAFCLVAVWVSSSPSESPSNQSAAEQRVSKSIKNEKDVAESERFEDSTGDLQMEIEEKTKENFKVTTKKKAEEGDNSETSSGKDDDKAFIVEKIEEQEADEGEIIAGDEGQLQKEAEDGEEKRQKMEDTRETVLEKDPELEDKREALKVEELAAGGEQSEIQIENKEIAGTWATQATESKKEKEKVNKNYSSDEEETEKEDDQILKEVVSPSKVSKKKENIEPNREDQEFDVEIKNADKDELLDRSNGKDGRFNWKLCQVEGVSAIDFIPCLDNIKVINKLPSTKHYEHRERHCPEEPPICLVPLPEAYRRPIPWPQSRKEVWYSNVPHPGLVSYKKDQNWVKKAGERLVFPGGGTQFKYGALNYIDFVEQTVPDIAWGKHTRIVLDVGCGVASFGGYLFDKDVLTMSFAPKDEHEAQVQLALERGIPAISSVMGTQRLVFPSNVYDMVHCARCRVPWHIEGGKLLLELNRVLRPGGYFVWSATPVYWKDEEDVSIWKAMIALTTSMCWSLLAKSTDSKTGIGVAIFQKPTNNFCYDHRQKKKQPPMCVDDNPDAAWYIKMTACLHKIPSEEGARATESPVDWPQRLVTAPTWLNNAEGLYGKQASADFRSDTEHWQRVVGRSYLRGLGIDWSRIRNVMDMRAVYGGFAAALVTQPVWVMNVVPTDAPDTLPVIFDRGLFGIYHDWCESLNTYPRTYDLLHADHLFSRLQKRSCGILPAVVEMDRILRPEGWAILRDKVDVITEVKITLKSMHWNVRLIYNKEQEGLLAVQKKMWRPEADS